MSVGPKKGERVRLSGLWVKSVLGDALLTSVAVDVFTETSLIPRSGVSFLE